jgi:hypothetical protein
LRQIIDGADELLRRAAMRCILVSDASLKSDTIVPLLDQPSFDPEFVEKLAAAYEDAWKKIETSGSTFARPRYRRVAQEITARRIIDMAQRGEIETDKLADDVVNYLSLSFA